MRFRSLAVVLLPVALVLTACAPEEATPSPSPTPSDSSTPSPTETAVPEPDALVISLDDLTLINDDGSAEGSTAFADGAGTLAFLYDRLDADPTVTRNEDGYPFTSYDWGGLSVLVIDGGGASIRAGAPEIEGLTLGTVEGVTVGDARADVVALGAVDGDYDGDGDGAADFVQLSTREAPDTQSLSNPGAVGVDYVMIDFEGDEVAGIHAPANDYSDV